MELKKKQKEIDIQKQRVTELTEIMDRQVRDKSRPVEHRQGMMALYHFTLNFVTIYVHW